MLNMVVISINAADSNINFHGIVIAGTCNFTHDSNQTVQLGDISTTQFGNPGDVSQAEPFSIILDCPEGGPAQATLT